MMIKAELKIRDEFQMKIPSPHQKKSDTTS